MFALAHAPLGFCKLDYTAHGRKQKVMANWNVKSVIVPIVIIAAGFAGIVLLSDFVRDRRPSLPETFTDSDLGMNGSRLKGFALGMEGLLADWYWIRSLQYIGDKMLRSRSLEL